MTVRRAVELLLLLLVLSLAGFTFAIKTDTAREAEAIAELNDRIAAERQRISELTAEWSALDHPARIQGLLERHNDVMGLQPISAHQIDAIDRVPAGPSRGLAADTDQ